MKKVFLFLLAIIPTMGNAYVNRDVAVLRIMDKDAGKVQELRISAGQEVQFEKLYINMRTCKQSDPFDAENFWAFVEITENNQGLIYSNWFNRNEPGQNPLQHPDYDVWLVKCE